MYYFQTNNSSHTPSYWLCS